MCIDCIIALLRTERIMVVNKKGKGKGAAVLTCHRLLLLTARPRLQLGCLFFRGVSVQTGGLLAQVKIWGALKACGDDSPRN